jgi:hypothetical protein
MGRNLTPFSGIGRSNDNWQSIPEDINTVPSPHSSSPFLFITHLLRFSSSLIFSVSLHHSSSTFLFITHHLHFSSSPTIICILFILHPRHPRHPLFCPLSIQHYDHRHSAHLHVVYKVRRPSSMLSLLHSAHDPCRHWHAVHFSAKGLL